MKKIIIFSVVFIALFTAQTKIVAQTKTIIEDTQTTPTGYIMANAQDYQNNMIRIWNINTGINKPIIIECNIDLDGGDYIYIYAVDNNNNVIYPAVVVMTGVFSWQDGLISTNLPTGKAKVVFITDNMFCGDPEGGEYYWGVESYYWVDNNYVYDSKILFGYDTEGNRISRTIVMQTPSPSPKSTIAQNRNQDQDQQDPPLTEQLTQNLQVKIYPNPTEGVLRVELTGLNDSSESHEHSVQITVINQSGLILQQKQAASSLNIIDLSAYPTGIYFLKLSIDGKVTDYKIIKK